MNYKKILNEQIEKLQSVQQALCTVNVATNAIAACEVAKTIEYLCEAVKRWPEEKTLEK